MILCTGLPISTTIADEWLNNLIFYDGIKCTIANGKMIMWDLMSHDDHSFCAKKFWEVLRHS